MYSAERRFHGKFVSMGIIFQNENIMDFLSIFLEIRNVLAKGVRDCLGVNAPRSKPAILKPINMQIYIKFIICLGEIAMTSSMEITLASIKRLTFATALPLLLFVQTQAQA